MGATRVRSVGIAGRAAVVLLAGVIGAMSPLTATAQVASTANEPWAPPPAGNNPPDDGGGQQTQIPYEQKTECVKRDLNNNVVPRERPWGQQYLQIEQAQKLAVAATGSAGGGIKVGVIDTGVTQHPDFKNGVQGGGDYVNASKNGLEDCDGHGTEVAGIIAANTPSDIGFKGVAPDSQIVSIRQSSQNYEVKQQTAPPAPPPAPGAPAGGAPPSSGNPPAGGGGGQTGGDNGQPGTREQNQGQTAGNTHTLAQAVRRAADLGVKVINMSVDNCRPADGSINTGERELQAAIHYAVNARDVVVVAAAGNTSDNCKQNDQPDPDQPKSIVSPPWFADDVLSVAAIDETGGVASFSMHGPWVSVAAPGTNITSLDPSSNAGDALANQVVEDGKTQPIQGTSFAAPYVAGIAALVRAQYPNLNARAVMRRIETTAQHPGAPGGHDNFIGYGVVNPVAALTEIIPAEEGIAPAAAQNLPSGLPPAYHPNRTPMIVALAGTGGGLLILLITLFVVHTVRRNRRGASAL